MKAFEEWWQVVPVEYTDVVNEDVAKAAYKAGMLRAAEALCKNCEAEGLNVRCDLCTDVAAIRKEAENGST